MNFGQPPMAGASLWLELAQAIDAVTAAVADCGSGALSPSRRSCGLRRCQQWDGHGSDIVILLSKSYIQFIVQ